MSSSSRMASDTSRRAAVLGSPIAHSKSPALHRAAYANLGLDWTYDLFDVNESQLADFLAGMDARWAGLSLTMPLKEAVIPLLESVSDQAMALRSVNTVLPGSQPGSWRGTNTDVQGIVSAITEAATRTGAAISGPAVILGAGATARSALAALPELGIAEAVVCARRPDAADDAATLGERLGLSMSTAPVEAERKLVQAHLVVSTLPGDAAQEWGALAASATGILLDASYHPWPTALASAWGGAAVASGRDMLLWQAVEQVRLMTGMDPDPAVMRAAMEADEAG